MASAAEEAELAAMFAQIEAEKKKKTKDTVADAMVCVFVVGWLVTLCCNWCAMKMAAIGLFCVYVLCRGGVVVCVCWTDLVCVV